MSKKNNFNVKSNINIVDSYQHIWNIGNNKCLIADIFITESNNPNTGIDTHPNIEFDKKESIILSQLHDLMLLEDDANKEESNLIRQLYNLAIQKEQCKLMQQLYNLAIQKGKSHFVFGDLNIRFASQDILNKKTPDVKDIIDKFVKLLEKK